MRRLVLVLNVVCLGLLACTLAAVVAGAAAMSATQRPLRIGPGLFLSAEECFDTFYLQFCNNDAGPYRGSIISVQGSSAPQPTCRGFNAPGIYYRHITFPGGAVHWTSMVSPVYPLAVLLPLPLVSLVVRLIRRRRMKLIQ